ncbi:hypothetical protein CCP3SC5AM1_70008 [Gammaproteobacteria bacterium]
MMQFHSYLWIVAGVGLSGIAVTNAADYGYGGGPWQGYGTPWGNGYGSDYARSRESVPWGGAPYDSISPSQGYHPSVGYNNPWDRGTESGYEPNYNGSPNYRTPPVQSGYYGGRSPGYYDGGNGSGFGMESGYGNRGSRNRPAHEGYGSAFPGQGWSGNPNYNSEYNNPNINSGDERRMLPGDRYGWGAGRGYQSAGQSNGRYDWSMNQSYGSPRQDTDEAPSWAGQGGNVHESSSYAHEKNGYGNNQYENVGPSNVGNNPGSGFGSQEKNGFGSDNREAISNQGGYSPWDSSAGSGTGLIPSPAGGLSPGSADTGKPAEESEKK